MTRIMMFAAACLLVAGCQETPVGPDMTAEHIELDASIDGDLSKKGNGNKSNNGNGPGPSASGASHSTAMGPKTTFSFHARTKKSGETSGSFQLRARGSNIHLKGTLDCLRIEDGLATVSGVISSVRGDNPFGIAPGWPVIFAVEDNGEGSKADDDRWTDLILTGPPPSGFHCSVTSIESERFWKDAKVGNFQVRP